MAADGPAKILRRSRLSNIPEDARVEARLLFTLIGPGAWQLAEELSRRATETFPSLAPRSRFAFAKQLSLPGRRRGKTCIGSRLRSADNAPFACKILLDEEDGEAERPAASEATSSRHRRARASRTSRTSRTSRVSSWSMASSNKSEPKSESSEQRRRMAAISFFPVEYFADEVPISHAIDRWRHSCLLFIVDPRQEASGQSILPELQRRQQEVMMWMKINGPRSQGVVPSSPPQQKQRLYAFVLFHRPPQAWGSTSADSLEAAEGRSLASEAHAEGAEERYKGFLQGVRDMACLPEGSVLCHECNFDDVDEVLRCHVRIAQGIVDAPRHELDSMETLATDFVSCQFSGESQTRACCAVM
mmetsp:Transcript_103158/g.300849  ORF Transcript_103158/g.300849 Transcript_103158/m.300849 type:complete len:360 (-) Transcript_103158:75-1154(-)